MSLTTSRKKKLDALKDPESRQYFYEEHIENGLPIQTRELRKRRKLTQKQLAELMGCDQSSISNWENPNYEYTPQIGTLQRLANIFDVPLIVRFGSWQELFEWDETLSPDKVAPETFNEFADRVEKKSTPRPALTLVVSHSVQGQQAFQFQRGELRLAASQEVSTDENLTTGDTHTTKVAVKAAGSAK